MRGIVQGYAGVSCLGCYPGSNKTYGNREHTPAAWPDTLSFEGIKHVSVSHMKLKDMNLVLESLLQHRNIDILKYHIKYHSEAIVSKDSFIREWSNRTLASPLA